MGTKTRYVMSVSDGDHDDGREYRYTNLREAERDATRIVSEGYRNAAKASVRPIWPEDSAPLAKWVNVGGRAVKVNV